MATVKLNNGAEVLAKLHKGELSAIGYSNRTQAENKAAKLGPDWVVFRPNRAFYVRKTA